MLKLLAELIIILGSGAYGLIMSQRHSKRPRQLRAMHQAVTALETEISYGATPLPQALTTAACGIDPLIGRLLLRVSEQILAQVPASQAWQSSCRDAKNDLCLMADDWKIVESVGVGLGTADRIEEVKKLKLVGNRLLSIEERAVASSVKLAKMWSYMGFLVGAAIALVIW